MLLIVLSRQKKEPERAFSQPNPLRRGDEDKSCERSEEGEQRCCKKLRTINLPKHIFITKTEKPMIATVAAIEIKNEYNKKPETFGILFKIAAI